MILKGAVEVVVSTQVLAAAVQGEETKDARPASKTKDTEAPEADAPPADSTPNVTLPNQKSQRKHIFRDAEGHLPDTPENEQKVLDVANNPDNYLGQDSRGNEWYAKTEDDGSQTWVRVRNGVVDNAGSNASPRIWNPVTGLYNNKS